MTTLTSIGVLFAAKLQAVLMAFVGLVAGILYSTIGAAYDVVTDSVGGGTALAFLAVIGMPLIFAAFGFVAGAVGAFLYNVFARLVGGIEIEMDYTQ